MEKNLNFNYCTQYQFFKQEKKRNKEKEAAAEKEDVNGKEMRMKGGRG
jgi:hypothetical protein